MPTPNPTTTSNPDQNSMPPINPTSLLKTYTTALKAFTLSQNTFQILTSLPTPPTSQTPTYNSLYILDSSFNPPTNAHASIALTALKHDPGKAAPPKRLLLLLSVQNADKAPKPASFPQRLVMMHLFALSLQEKMRVERKSPSTTKPTTASDPHPSPSSSPQDNREGESETPIDIALTTHPYFVQKSLAISSSPSYPAHQNPTQIHLTGHDTLIRILNPKYYPSKDLSSLQPFLETHRLLVFYREEENGGTGDGKEEQDRYLAEVGKRGGEEGRWVREGRIMHCEIGREGKGVSSTRVREAVKNRDEAELGELVCRDVGDWILSEKLYLGD